MKKAKIISYVGAGILAAISVIVVIIMAALWIPAMNEWDTGNDAAEAIGKGLLITIMIGTLLIGLTFPALIIGFLASGKEGLNKAGFIIAIIVGSLGIIFSWAFAGIAVYAIIFSFLDFAAYILLIVGGAVGVSKKNN